MSEPRANTPPSAHENDLYVGYLPTPRRHRRAMRLAVPTIMWGLCAISALIAGALAPAGSAIWDSDTTTIEGTLIGSPYLAILHQDHGTLVTTFLVESGKHGPRTSLTPRVGQPITVDGFILHRDGRRVLELLPGDAGVKPPAAAPPPRPPLAPANTNLGPATLRGEIVDYKCYLGAMKPGEGVPHRACARLCVSAGIPPVLVTTDAAGQHTYYVLRTPDYAPLNQQVLPLVGVPVEIRGSLTREADVLYLETSPEQISAL